KKITQKKKLLVDNECGTIDYGLEKTLLSEITKEPISIHKETETLSSQKKTATAVEKNTETPNKRKIYELTSKRKEENNYNPETRKK
ncbi:39890_t:CDS:1, partial [Gigaspora margarita]